MSVRVKHQVKQESRKEKEEVVVVAVVVVVVGLHTHTLTHTHTYLPFFSLQNDIHIKTKMPSKTITSFSPPPSIHPFLSFERVFMCVCMSGFVFLAAGEKEKVIPGQNHQKPSVASPCAFLVLFYFRCCFFLCVRACVCLCVYVYASHKITLTYTLFRSCIAFSLCIL